MPAELTDNTEAILARLRRIDPRELEATIPRAAAKGGAAARTVLRRGGARLLGKEITSIRLQGQRDRAYFGINPVPLTALHRAGKASGLAPGQFILQPGTYNRKGGTPFTITRPLLLQRRPNGSLFRPEMPIEDLITPIFDQAATRAGEVSIDALADTLLGLVK